MRREFLEELGVTAQIGDLLYRGEFSNRGKRYRLMAYAAELLGEEFTLAEHQRLDWFTLEEAEKLSMAGSDRQILEALRELS